MRGAWAVFVAMGLAGTMCRAQQGPAERLKAVDRQFAEQSYAGALKTYEELTRENAVPADRRDEVAYRTLVSLGHTQQWDRAIADSIAFVKARQGTVWEPRGLYWLGRLYAGAYHEAYRTGTAVTRTYDVPASPGQSAPERIYLHAADATNAMDALEAARVLFPRYRREFHTEAEEIQLDYDLAHTLESDYLMERWAASRAWLKEDPRRWSGDAAHTYRTDWPIPRKELYLYGQIERLAALRSDRHARALARFGKALWTFHYRTFMDTAALSWKRGQARPVRLPYPGREWSYEAQMHRMLKDFPGDPSLPDFQCTLARIKLNMNDRKGAVAELNALLNAFPNSAWTGYARTAIAAVRAPRIECSEHAPMLPGVPCTVQFGVTATPQLRLVLYRLDAARLYGDIGPRMRGSRQWMELCDCGIDLAKPNPSLARKVAEWRQAVPGTGDFQRHTVATRVPALTPGLYLLVAEHGSTRAAATLAATDLAATLTLHANGATLYLCNSRTGRTVPEAQVTLHCWWRDANSKEASTTLRGVTDRNGLCHLPKPPGYLAAAPACCDLEFGAFVTRGSSCALVGNPWSGGYEGTDQTKFQLTTDRALYRPGQTVSFRLAALRGTEGDCAPLRGQALTVIAHDPNGKEIARIPATTGEFGTVAGQFPIVPGAPLGSYPCSVQPAGSVSPTTVDWIRVEEYKKPEYEVTATPVQPDLRIGQQARVRIAARYYMGSPVPGARVVYRIVRHACFADYESCEPFGGSGRAGTGWAHPGHGAAVQSGEVTTDARGMAEIAFGTDDDQGPRGDDRSYEAEIMVQDAGRRAVYARAYVTATRHSVYAYLRSKENYLVQGERAHLDIATTNVAGAGIAAAGTLRIYRIGLPAHAPDTLVEERRVATNARGRGAIDWRAAESGAYRLEFSAPDRDGLTAKVTTKLFVDGPSLRDAAFTYPHLYLAVKAAAYQEGDTAEALIVTPAPGCDVMLFRAVGEELVETRVVHVPGRSLRVPLAITSRDLPNTFLSAVAIHQGRTFQSFAEIRVPPTRRRLDIGVASAKPAYRPGEQAEFHLTARDCQGRPQRAEVSVGVSDAALSALEGKGPGCLFDGFYGLRRTMESHTETSTEEDLPTMPWTVYERRIPDVRWDRPAGMGLMPEFRTPTALEADISFIYPRRSNMAEALSWQRQTAAMRQPEQRLPLPDTWLPAIHGVENALSIDAGAIPPPTPRSDFRDTAFWSPSVITDADGKAEVRFTWPDNLTRWDARAEAITPNGDVGGAATSVVTRKEIMVRLEAPRFFVERDRVRLSAILHNDTATEQEMRVRLEPGDCLTPVNTATEASVKVAARGESRVEWPMEVHSTGTARVRVFAQCAAGADAVEMSYPVLVHGMERFTTRNGAVRDSGEARLTAHLPGERAAGSEHATLHLTASVAGVALDALPELIGDEYDCNEQAASRFAPAVVAVSRLKAAGATPEAIARRSGKAGQPALDPAQVGRLLANGLQRLAVGQHPDGGWGWWSESTSDRYITCYIYHSLLRVRAAGYEVPQKMVEHARGYLVTAFHDSRDTDFQLLLARALSLEPEARREVRADLVGRIYSQRDTLDGYSLALLAIALDNLGERRRAEIALGNAANTLRTDEANGTAYWDCRSTAWWTWQASKPAATAAMLEATLQIDPKSATVPMLARWLVNNRRGHIWRSTLETADVVYALTDYARAERELTPELAVAATLPDGTRRAFRVNAENALLFDEQIELPAGALPTGEYAVNIETKGRGTLYYALSDRYFSREEPIQPTANEIAVTRRYFRVLPDTTPAPARVAAQPPHVNAFLAHDYACVADAAEVVPAARQTPPTRVPLQDGEAVASGDLVEVQLELEAKNDYDYVAFEDMKPAGFEPVDTHSGYIDGLGLWAHMELRDQKVAFFVNALPQGRRTLTYRLRAETRGTFHALPTHAHAMYAPEVSAISGEQRMEVK